MSNGRIVAIMICTATPGGYDPASWLVQMERRVTRESSIKSNSGSKWNKLTGMFVILGRHRQHTNRYFKIILRRDLGGLKLGDYSSQ